ncbi:hypothetical protein DACRYDRAFT_23639 [Dacryopinax primogenitus]|uniref:Uncharacterized protein n=1 Tax=Dacryopinax primogenitus (strain DJM 731) TaxID=1858805 RepID=M5FTS3_DACPD|nr:uncharacterized protein DACRYDRAFT_23639 [Dacryopinax primogenitus]EJT99518.1 hypothetical protein DACRYDRAFT_23639 [Dacryopinax primogenitus]
MTYLRTSTTGILTLNQPLNAALATVVLAWICPPVLASPPMFRAGWPLQWPIPPDNPLNRE